MTKLSDKTEKKRPYGWWVFVEFLARF